MSEPNSLAPLHISQSSRICCDCLCGVLGCLLDLLACVFSSSHARTGTPQDLDLALLVPDERCQIWAQFNAKTILKNISKVFHKHAAQFSMQTVFSAKVPVIKLKHKGTGIDVDIIIGDAHNAFKTKLMRSAMADGRVQPLIPLITAVKAFAKAHDVGDASTGTLSSFAWTMLTVAMCQFQCQHPPLRLDAAYQAALASGVPLDNRIRMDLGRIFLPQCVTVQACVCSCSFQIWCDCLNVDNEVLVGYAASSDLRRHACARALISFDVFCMRIVFVVNYVAAGAAVVAVLVMSVVVFLDCCFPILGALVHPTDFSRPSRSIRPHNARWAASCCHCWHMWAASLVQPPALCGRHSTLKRKS